jgi:hypothetical protein
MTDKLTRPLTPLKIRRAERTAQVAVDMAEVQKQAMEEVLRSKVHDRDAQIIQLDEHLAHLEATLACMRKPRTTCGQIRRKRTGLP